MEWLIAGVPRFSLLPKLRSVLGISLGSLLCGESDAPPPSAS